MPSGSTLLPTKTYIVFKAGKVISRASDSLLLSSMQTYLGPCGYPLFTPSMLFRPDQTGDNESTTNLKETNK